MEWGWMPGQDKELGSKLGFRRGYRRREKRLSREAGNFPFRLPFFGKALDAVAIPILDGSRSVMPIQYLLTNKTEISKLIFAGDPIRLPPNQ